MSQNSNAIQVKYAAKSICFGCGPANDNGLKIESIPLKAGSPELYAEWRPKKFHEAFPGVLNGGIIGALLDCHSNWTAAYALMLNQSLQEPPCTVTADFHVVLKRPTPTDGVLRLESKVIEIKTDRATIQAVLLKDGKICATCTGTFVAVKADHPAYHRW